MKKKEKSDKIEQATKKEKTNKIDTIETKKFRSGRHSNKRKQSMGDFFFDCLLTTNDKSQAKFNENTNDTAFAYYIFRVDEKKYGCDARYAKHFENVFLRSGENRYVAYYYMGIWHFTGQWQKNGQIVFE